LLLNPKRFKKKDAPVLSAFSFLGPAFTITATEEIGCSVETVTTLIPLERVDDFNLGAVR